MTGVLNVNETEIKLHVGAKVKQYRQKNKLTQFKLGELIDINQRQVAQIECGKSFPSLPTLIKLSNVFQHSISDFFDVEMELPEKELKEFLKAKIENSDYNECQKLYAIIRALG